MLAAFVCFDPSLLFIYSSCSLKKSSWYSLWTSSDSFMGIFAASNNLKGFTKAVGTLSMLQVPRLPRQPLQGRRCMDEEASWRQQDIRMIGHDSWSRKFSKYVLQIQTCSKIFTIQTWLKHIKTVAYQTYIIISYCGLWSQLFFSELLVSVPCPRPWVAYGSL